MTPALALPFPASPPAPAPSPVRAPPRRPILIHLTPFAPRILPDAPMPHPSRWMSLHGPSPVQAVRKLADRLDRRLDRLAFRMAAAPGEVEVIDPAAPGQVLAIVIEGLSCGDLQTAHAAALSGRLL